MKKWKEKNGSNLFGFTDKAVMIGLEIQIN